MIAQVVGAGVVPGTLFFLLRWLFKRRDPDYAPVWFRDRPNSRFQPTSLPPLRVVRAAAEAWRYRAETSSAFLGKIGDRPRFIFPWLSLAFAGQ